MTIGEEDRVVRSTDVNVQTDAFAILTRSDEMLGFCTRERRDVVHEVIATSAMTSGASLLHLVPLFVAWRSDAQALVERKSPHRIQRSARSTARR